MLIFCLVCRSFFEFYKKLNWLDGKIAIQGNFYNNDSSQKSLRFKTDSFMFFDIRRSYGNSLFGIRCSKPSKNAANNFSGPKVSVLKISANNNDFRHEFGSLGVNKERSALAVESLLK